jgi:hypothetical protein
MEWRQYERPHGTGSTEDRIMAEPPPPCRTNAGAAGNLRLGFCAMTASKFGIIYELARPF